MSDRFKIMDLWTDQEREAPQIAREKEGCCEQCGSTKDVKWRVSMTSYHYDELEKLESPNRSLFYCEGCSEQYIEYWNDMWSNVPGFFGW